MPAAATQPQARRVRAFLFPPPGDARNHPRKD